MRAAWWLVVVALAIPARAHAFSDPALFGQGVDKGGGDGRYFTGSRADGYACSVCHRGGTAPTIVVDGIPDAPVAGTRYELVIHWPDPTTAHALQLELTTPSGGAPSVTITPAAMLPAESRCDGLPAGAPAVYTVDAGVRKIVGVEDCHASSVTVSFVATGEPIDLAIGAITSDENGDVEGDGTYELRMVIGEHLVASGGGGCNTSGGDAGLLVALALLTVARRRRAP
ncbi:MAG: hypothetical protein ABI175_27630 [Polyangiales bacterium]